LRSKKSNITPKEKLKSGVNRVLRIIRSYKSTAFADLMDKIRTKMKIEKDKKENRRRSVLMRSAPLTPEERTQQILIDLVSKVESLKDKIYDQDKQISELKEDLGEKIEQLK